MSTRHDAPCDAAGSGSIWSVMTRKVGTAANGSTSAKIEVNATSENWTSGDPTRLYYLPG